MIPLSLESRLVVLLGVLFGAFALCVVPPLVTFDGPGHFFRAIQIAHGEFRAVPFGPNRIGGTISLKDSVFVDQAWTSYWHDKDFGTLTRWTEWSHVAEQRQGTGPRDITNIAIESPVNHFVQAAGIRLSSLFSSSPLWAARIGSLSNLLGYLVIIIATIELLPGFRRGVLLFATSPLILIQAASLSHDAMNFSLPALFIAVAWRLRRDNRPVPSWKLTLLLGLSCSVALLKPIAVGNLACLFLLPTTVFGSLRRRILILALIFGCAGALWLAWNLPYTRLDIAAAMDPSRPTATTAAHKEWAASHPLHFIPVFGRFLARDVWEQWPAFYGGVGGWISSTVQRTLHQLSLVFVMGLLVSQIRGKKDPIWAGGLMLQSLILLFGTCLVCWLALGTVGLDVVPGLSGRYLHLVYLAFFAGLLQFSPMRGGWVPALGFWAGLSANVASLLCILIPIARTVLR